MQTHISVAELGLNSVQMQDEKLVDMAAYKMDWSPMEVPPPALRSDNDENSAPQGKRRKISAADKNRHWCLTCKQVRVKDVYNTRN